MTKRKLWRWRAPYDAPFVSGNRVQPLNDGGPYFAALIDAIAGAQHYVFVETYILAADKTGWRVGRALAEKALQGVEVALIFDGFGSFGLDPYFVSFLVEAGVRLHRFRPISILRGRWPWTRRNHRKLCVVDGRIGLVGGMNISDDYAAIEDGGRGWRDYAVRIEGPAVTQLEALFRWLWRRHARQPLDSPPITPPSFPGGYQVRFAANFARRDRAEIRRDYLQAIVAAERHIRITAAYFTPDGGLLRALRRAAKRGVKVELITAGSNSSDVKLVGYVSRGLYGLLLKVGVEINEWRGRVLHAKVAVIDGRWTTIGSANLNYRTYLFDYEVNATILGAEIARVMEDQFAIDRRRSEAISLERWRERPLLDRALSWFFSLFRRAI